MKRILLSLVLLSSLAGVVCWSITRGANQASQSAFLSQFSLQKTIEKVNAPGLACSGFRSGDGGKGSARGIGSGGVSYYQRLSIFCGIERPAQFQEAGFFLALKTEIEDQIKNTGAQVQGGSISGNSLQVEYTDEKSRGKIEMTGQIQGAAYIVKAKIDENTQ